MLKKLLPAILVPILGLGASETLLKLPPMATPPVIDGKINDAEWQGGSVQFGAISRQTGILSRRVVYFYFGYDENHLYFAHRSELPPPPMKVDAGDDAMLTVVPPGAKAPFVFRLRELKAPTGTIPGHWESEVAIPLRKIGVEKIEYGKPWKLQMSRCWSRPDEIGDWAGREFATFIPQKNIPAAGFAGLWLAGIKPYRGQSCHIRWLASGMAGEVACDAEIVSVEVPRQFHRALPVEPGKVTEFQWRALLSPGTSRTLQYTLSGKPGGEVLLRRELTWDGAKGLLWVDPDPPVGLSVGIYPTYGRAKARLSCSNTDKLKALKQVAFVIADRSGKEYYRFAPDAGQPEHHFKLPELPEKEYLLTAEFVDSKGQLQHLSEPFAIRKFPWQNLHLGTERIIVPPFLPLAVKDDREVHALQTGYRMG